MGNGARQRAAGGHERITSYVVARAQQQKLRQQLQQDDDPELAAAAAGRRGIAGTSGKEAHTAQHHGLPCPDHQTLTHFDTISQTQR